MLCGVLRGAGPEASRASQVADAWHGARAPVTAPDFLLRHRRRPCGNSPASASSRPVLGVPAVTGVPPLGSWRGAGLRVLVSSPAFIRDRNVHRCKWALAHFTELLHSSSSARRVVPASVTKTPWCGVRLINRKLFELDPLNTQYTETKLDVDG